MYVSTKLNYMHIFWKAFSMLYTFFTGYENNYLYWSGLESREYGRRDRLP
jgi:hypothetical protein